MISEQRFTDVVTVGETMALMRSTVPGPLAHNAQLGLGVGGSESNFAIALRRLGASVTWVGRVGQDALGDLVEREIRGEDVHTVVVRDPQAATALMIKESRTSHHQKVYYYRQNQAGSRIEPADLPRDVISRAKALHLTGISAGLSSSSERTLHAAIDIAQAAGVQVVFDLNYRAGLWNEEQAREAYARILPRVDVVFAGDDEAAIALGHHGEPAALAEGLAALGPTQAIIKLGERGCAALIDGTYYEREAVAVDAVDTVGAGDAFVAGYVAELLAGLPPADRLETAVRTGAFACLVPGDWEGMPRRNELGLLGTSEPVIR
ncbi:sugar kinase [Glutamicibacter sp. NPDC087344]|uniref:sugar kinase n=1 Tax=Glutamicibacter sp. NPDC087344 TaxID=3363994 RepID=UPI00380A046A